MTAWVVRMVSRVIGIPTLAAAVDEGVAQCYPDTDMCVAPKACEEGTDIWLRKELFEVWRDSFLRA